MTGNTLLPFPPPGNTAREHFTPLLTSREQCQEALCCTAQPQGTLYYTAPLQGTVLGKTFYLSSPPGTLPGNTSFQWPSPGNSATQGTLFPFLGNIYIIFSLPIASKYTDRLQVNFVFSLLLLRYIRPGNVLFKIGPKFGP